MQSNHLIMQFLFFVLLSLIPISCSTANETNKSMNLRSTDNFDRDITPAAHQVSKYLPFLKGKKLGLVVNQTSTIGDTHLVDSLKSLGCLVEVIFAPEHGFRGKADRGEYIKDDKDPKTGIKIISLYGKNLRPTAEMLKNLDLIVFDIQDIGVRFFTYTSTMTYMMEACAENKKPMLILDRPNPIGFCVDGPVLEKQWKSFIGLHPVPVIHGLTTAEYAKMINEEGWLRDSLKCELYLELCSAYEHGKYYELPVKPSPNLPNARSIYLYPSLCLFEGTSISMGRGTNKQFQVYGHPLFKRGRAQFTPSAGEGDKSPIHNNQICYGFDLSNCDIDSLRKNLNFNIDYIIDLYKNSEPALKSKFFNEDNFFHKLVGNDRLKSDIINGKSADEIRKEWEPKLNEYKKMRKKYLLYKE